MRKIIANTEVESLSDTQKEEYLNCHIPYRLRLLHLGLGVFPPRSWIECAAFEAALVYGRQLVEFLGLGIDANQFPPVLREKIRYHRYERDGVANTDEVKITDLGGDFLLRSALTKEEQSILAEFCFGASKATAHLTESSNHKLNHNNGEIFMQGCELIIKLVNENLAKIPR